MPKAIAPGRFPVPLRSSVPAEAAMLQELESVKGTYGAINECMREWLMRGIKELEQRTQQVPSDGGDATRALLAVATELTNSVAISQHLLTMYVQAKQTLAEAPRSHPASAEPLSAAVSAPLMDAVTSQPSSEPSSENVEPAEKPRWGHLKGLVGG